IDKVDGIETYKDFIEKRFLCVRYRLALQYNNKKAEDPHYFVYRTSPAENSHIAQAVQEIGRLPTSNLNTLIHQCRFVGRQIQKLQEHPRQFTYSNETQENVDLAEYKRLFSSKANRQRTPFESPELRETMKERLFEYYKTASVSVRPNFAFHYCNNYPTIVLRLDTGRVACRNLKNSNIDQLVDRLDRELTKDCPERLSNDKESKE
ncbi:MAG: hypothetical protein AAF203_07840, partial [Pseudomonadota bacterium]